MLIPIAGHVAALVAPSGIVELSWILGDEAEEVLGAYAAVGLRLRRRADLNEWCALQLRAGDPA